MVVDSPALIAVILREPDALELLAKLSQAPVVNLSTVTLVEASTVLLSRAGQVKVDMLDALLLRLNARFIPVDHAQALLAREAYDRYGKGRHKARLNLGDCFTYALVKRYGEPLLFKGDDFSHTDIIPA